MPYSGPGGAADGRDQRHPDRLEQRADVVALRRVELLDGLAHPAVHVGAVVAVADRRVELDELGPMLGDAVRVRRAIQSRTAAAVMLIRHCAAPACRTGASHSRVSSSSSLSSVIEQPAISSEVM